MFVNLTPIVSGGVLDNTTRGVTRLSLRCPGLSSPLTLELCGDCWADIAGCKLNFELRMNAPLPTPRMHEALLAFARSLRRSSNEQALVGDMTGSLRAPSRLEDMCMANFLSLEFFIGARHRCLIESEEFDFMVSEPAWECSAAAESSQMMLNMNTMRDHVVDYVAHFRGSTLSQLGKDMPPCRWDYELDRSEAFLSIAPAIRDKYLSHPRGYLAEAFVLDRTETLAAAAAAEERGRPFPADLIPEEWKFTDFLSKSTRRQVLTAVNNPLYMAANQLLGALHRFIDAGMNDSLNDTDVQKLIIAYSGAISHLLATLLLTQQRRVPIHTVATRAAILHTRLERMGSYTSSIEPKARARVSRCLKELLGELSVFRAKYA